MSHISKIELEVTDLSILSRACKRLGLNLIRGKQTFKWYGKDSSCHHAIIIPDGSYEIGIVKKEGKFELSCDFYDRYLQSAIGANAGLLKQAYAVEKATYEARKKGFSVIEKKHHNAIRLHVRIS